MIKSGFNKIGLCRLCKRGRTEEGHDPCIANLPGVQFACCGHGIEEGYIKFEDGRCLRFVPLKVELDIPIHEMIAAEISSPVFLQNERYHELNFKTGKVKTKHGDYTAIAVGNNPVTIRRRTNG